MHTYWWYIHTCIYTYIYLNSFILLVRIHHGKVNSYRLEVNFLCKPVAGILGSLRAVVSVFSYGTLSLRERIRIRTTQLGSWWLWILLRMQNRLGVCVVCLFFWSHLHSFDFPSSTLTAFPSLPVCLWVPVPASLLDTMK